MNKIISKQFTTTVVGLGNMGFPMALNLLKNRETVFGFDASNDVALKFASLSLQKTVSIEEAVAQSQFVITVLPNYKIVSSIWEQATKVAKPGTMFLDCSTIGPNDSKAMQTEAQKKGLITVDAPMSGGVKGASDGTLSFLCGCKAEHFQKAEEILSKMGKKVIRCGEHGSGAAMKLVNNICLSINMAATAESVELGRRLGLDPKIMGEVMAASTSKSWPVEVNFPIGGVVQSSASSRDFERGFSAELMLKDVNLAIDSGEETQLDMKIAKFVKKYYEKVVQDGLKNKDFSYIYQNIRDDKI